MATSMQDYSPINSLQKMVDTIPVNNVNSSGSEKKSTKNISVTNDLVLGRVIDTHPMARSL